MLGALNSGQILSRRSAHGICPAESEYDDGCLQLWFGSSPLGTKLFSGMVSGLCQEESRFPLNITKALVVFKVLQFFEQSLKQGDLLIQTDNPTILSCLNQIGGTKSHSPNQLAVLPGQGHHFASSPSLGVDVKGDRLFHHLGECQGNLDKSVEWSLDQGVANVFHLWMTDV